MAADPLPPLGRARIVVRLIPAVVTEAGHIIRGPAKGWRASMPETMNIVRDRPCRRSHKPPRSGQPVRVLSFGTERPARCRTRRLTGRLVVAAVATHAVACAAHSPRYYTPRLYGSLRRQGQPVAGTVVASLPNGRVAASMHTAALGDFAFDLPPGNTYTIRGTTDDRTRCAPASIAIAKVKIAGPQGPSPPWSVSLTCAPARVVGGEIDAPRDVSVSVVSGHETEYVSAMRSQMRSGSGNVSALGTCNGNDDALHDD